MTIRDRTELQGALGELSSLQVLTDSLRSQAHEAANKLHTVITMVEMGRSDEAVTFATNELELSQQLVDRLSTDVGEPALVALLLGKTAQADERGIELSVTEETHLPSNTDDVPLSGQEMVTVLGNLIDNAMDACDREDPWVEVTVSQDDGTTADPGGRQRFGHGRRDLREGHAARLFDQVRLRRRTARPRAGAGRAGRQAAQRHADRRRDVRLGGHGDGERLMISVLIVEDEPLIAEAHQAYLERLEGFSVAAVAHTARDAMRAAADAAAGETPIDLVLLDIGLPDASGIALASGLSGLRPAPDIIAITSERDLEMVRAAVGHGALAYLLKPFTFAAFRDRLERYQRYREALPAGTDAASQAEVDRALAELRISTDRSVAPKGAASGTNDEIARAVRDSADGITADAVAKQVGVSRVTAWRYLERLADEGTVTRQHRLRQGGPAEDPLPVALTRIAFCAIRASRISSRARVRRCAYDGGQRVVRRQRRHHRRVRPPAARQYRGRAAHCRRPTRSVSPDRARSNRVVVRRRCRTHEFAQRIPRRRRTVQAPSPRPRHIIERRRRPDLAGDPECLRASCACRGRRSGSSDRRSERSPGSREASRTEPRLCGCNGHTPIR